MAGKKSNEGKTDNVIIFPDDRRAEVRKDAADELSSDNALIVDDLAIADARLKIRQIEINIKADRKIFIDFLVDSGYITMDQVRTDEETDECLVVIDGKEMEISEAFAHIRKIREDEEAVLHQKSKKTD